ncbi:MAG: hypothetical protein Q9227_003113 [Pyrenula ochraceoflavens]
MPKIISYTPSWLSRPNPGSKIFTDSNAQTSSSLSNGENGSTKINSYSGPRRLLAKRGDEIFVLIVPVYGQIRQLVVSRSGIFLAILTEHTVHVSILPDSTHLRSGDRSPMKLKTFQLGPTTHVLPQSPVVAALWHPLAVSTATTDCLVTVTADAAVRIWELDRTNQWTFDRPALAIDLTKLADGTSCDENFEPRGFGKSKGFSADEADMEVASACFEGQGLGDEDGWAPMTLWVVMKTGDVYAMCPLLPSHWMPTQSTVSSLATSVVSEMAGLDTNADDEDATQLQQRYQWVQELDQEAPVMTAMDENISEGLQEVLNRPTNPSPIPRLQGPFLTNAEDEDTELYLEVADIYVMASKHEAEEDLDEIDLGQKEPGISATVICLTSSDRQLQICLSLEGVQGQWLPKKKKASFMIPSPDPKELIVVETLRISKPSKTHPEDKDVTNWPAITPDIYSRYDFYVTSSNSVNYYSLSSWASRLEKELAASSKFDNQDLESSGLPFRLQLLCEGQITFCESLLIFDSDPTGYSHLPACQIFAHEDLGYLLLTFGRQQGHALILDPPHDETSADHSPALFRDSKPYEIPEDSPEPDVPAPRPSYTPSQAFYTQPAASIAQIRSQVSARHRSTLNSEIRFSPSTLGILSSAHRGISVETNTIEKAAAELFRRVERLRNELHSQLSQMTRVAEQLQNLTQNQEEAKAMRGEYDERVERARRRQKEMVARYEKLRRRMGRSEVLSGRGSELSTKEREWVEEVGTLAKRCGVDVDGASTENGTSRRDEQKDGAIGARFDMVESLYDKLLPEARAILSSLEKEQQDAQSSPSVNPSSSPSPAPPLSRNNSSAGSAVPLKVQRARMADAMVMVEREGAVIEAALRRLENLSLGVEL